MRLSSGGMLRGGVLLGTIAVCLAGFTGVALAQSNAGLDAYTENPPGTTTPGGSTGSSSGAGARSGTGTGEGVPGTAPIGDRNGDGVLSETEAGKLGNTTAGQLPATGFSETGLMALIGAVLLGAGLLLRRATDPAR